MNCKCTLYKFKYEDFYATEDNKVMFECVYCGSEEHVRGLDHIAYRFYTRRQRQFVKDLNRDIPFLPGVGVKYKDAMNDFKLKQSNCKA